MELPAGLIGLATGIKEFQKIFGKDKIKRIKTIEKSVAGIKYQMQQQHIPDEEIDHHIDHILKNRYPDYSKLKSEYAQLDHANNQFEGNERDVSKNKKPL